MVNKEEFNLYEIRFRLLDKNIRCYYNQYIHILNILLSIFIGYFVYFKFEWTSLASFVLIPFLWLILFLIQESICSVAEKYFLKLLGEKSQI